MTKRRYTTDREWLEIAWALHGLPEDASVTMIADVVRRLPDESTR